MAAALPIDVAVLIRKFMVFSFVGGIATAAHFGLMIILFQLGSDALIASAFGYAFGAIVGYLLNYHVTFRSEKRHIETIFKYCTVVAVGLLINSALMALFLQVAGVYYIFAQCWATGLVLVWNFSANQFWTFGSRSLQ
jgi:putative flippase GtrA